MLGDENSWELSENRKWCEKLTVIHHYVICVLDLKYVHCLKYPGVTIRQGMVWCLDGEAKRNVPYRK